jgi:hypothetical protein
MNFTLSTTNGTFGAVVLVNLLKALPLMFNEKQFSVQITGCFLHEKRKNGRSRNSEALDFIVF